MKNPFFCWKSGYSSNRCVLIQKMSSRNYRPTPSSMTQIQKNYCIKVTRKIMDYPISVFFLNPVDPERDRAPDYFQKIRRPMDLGTVMKKLEGDNYSTVDKWKEEMNLIWKNATTYNNESNYIYMIAKELSDIFRKFCENVPKTEIDFWLYKVRKTHTKLMKLIESKPDPTRKLSIQSNQPKAQRQTKILLRQKSKQTTNA